jgi:hypothetical protein
LLEGRVLGQQNEAVSVTSLELIEKPESNGPIVVAGDSNGCITLIKKDLQTQ